MAGSSSARERFNVARLALQFPWLTIGFWVAVSIAGLVGFSSLKYALFPDITFPVVVVSAKAPAVDAFDTEQSLTVAIEKQLGALQGVTRVRSASYPGQTVIDVSFTVDTDLAEAGRRVEAEIADAELPPGAEVTVRTLNLNESPAVTYALESDRLDRAALAIEARRRILPEIARLPGVLKVTLLGDPAERQNAVRFNGDPALALQVVKRAEANTLDVVRTVEQEAERLRRALPDVRLEVAATQARFIKEATQATVDALGLAVLLSAIVIYPFLRDWRATFISALAIPMSLLGTFIVMAVAGFNLETITLLALALVIGIIVDDAIVDVENIARHLEEGETPAEAAVSATNEIGLTVTAATLTIVAVFLPVGLMGGTVGQFFRPFGLTVSAAVLTSLLVARTLSPLLASLWLKSSDHKRATGTARPAFVDLYQRALVWALSRRWTVLGIALAVFLGGIALLPVIPKGFIPKLDRGEFLVNYTAPLPTNLAASERIAERLDAAVRAIVPEAERVYTVAGSRQGEAFRGTIHVRLKDKRTANTGEIERRLRASLPAIPDVAVSVEDIPFLEASAGEKPLQVGLIGQDIDALALGLDRLVARARQIPGLVDVETAGIATYGDQIVQVSHLAGRRVVYLSANLAAGLSLGDATDRIVTEAQNVLPAGVTVDLGGDSARAAETFGAFGMTLLLSVLCIFAVLWLLFRNWFDPLVILFALPLSLVGALVAPLLTGSEFGMISVIGIIFLLGLANKNAILLVDYINQLRARGLSLNDAILKAGPIRLRPILMTTAATILGMVPIALGFGAGAELRAPMAVAIIGGLITSTLLSLLVVPVVYSLLADLRQGKLFIR